jgi:guanidinoacetate N-methyltransferase
MKPRTRMQTIRKSLRAMSSTPPSKWYERWKRRSGALQLQRDYRTSKAQYSENELTIGGHEVMQDWERPLMRALAEEAARSKGHVLEVGFGMGISATYLIEAGCSRYTVIEPHPAVLAEFGKWAADQPVPVEAIEGFWEDVIDGLGTFDGILFDTYPTMPSKDDASSPTDTASSPEGDHRVYLPFIPKASEHLNPGGVFTFFTSYAEALPREHMDLLNRYFSEVRTYQVDGLNPPETCEYWQESKMVVPVCVK